MSEIKRNESSFRNKIIRCGWAKNDLAILYHDREWGVPQHDDRVLFEFLVLEGAQAELSWDTILRKRVKRSSSHTRPNYWNL